jgi:hypothetical protein
MKISKSFTPKTSFSMKLRQLLIPFLFLLPTLGCDQKSSLSTRSAAPKENPKFSLEEVEHRTFRWFWDLIDANYQVPDRHPQRNFTSIAATGFGLTAYCIGAERGYVTRAQAAERTVKTLRALWAMPQGDGKTGVSGYKGFYYHFLDHEKSLRFQEIELSSIDTGLLMAGILSVMSYFDKENDPIEREIYELTEKLYRRVDWTYFLTKQNNLSMGYSPERGFLTAEWVGYNEAMVLLIMAIGSPTHAIPADAWERWCKPYEWTTFKGQEHVNFDPLFGHQYSQMYVDFKGIQDPYMAAKGIDYFENSRRATLANRAYCIENPQKFKNYSANEWGLTACDGPNDTLVKRDGKDFQFLPYRARGAASMQIIDDGTIAPTAVAGSIPFAPEVCIPALENMWNKYYNTPLITEYGFKDAYNPTYTFYSRDNSNPNYSETGWIDRDYLGIDQGPIIIQIENHRSAFVWQLMRKNPYIVAGLKKAGFKGGWLDKKN